MHRPGLLVLPVAQTSGKTAPQSAGRAARSLKLEVGNNGFIIEIMHRLMLGYRNSAEFARGGLSLGIDRSLKVAFAEYLFVLTKLLLVFKRFGQNTSHRDAHQLQTPKRSDLRSDHGC